MIMNKYKFITSFGEHSISLSLHDCVIDTNRKPVNETYGNCFFKIVNTNGYCEYQSTLFETIPDCFRFPQKIKDGTYRFCICFKSPYEDNIYYDLFGPQRGIPIRKNGRCIEFIPSPILKHNKSFLDLQNKYLHNGVLSHGLKPSHMIQSTAPEIIGLAKELTRNSADTISMIKDIYFYVSRTLLYDKVSLDNGSYCYTGQTAYEVLKHNKCVCQGFANLTVAMCRAIGIPSFSVAAFVKSDKKQWGDFGNDSHQCSNHQIALAWANCYDRWIVMDPTWDNDQYYDTNGYGERHGNGLVYNYFDVTTEFISYTHRFEKILNI